MWRWFPQLGTYKQCCVEYPFTQWQVPSIGQTPRSATTWEEGKSGPIPWPKVFKMKWSPWIISEAPVITTFVIPQPNLRWPPPHTHTHKTSQLQPQDPPDHCENKCFPPNMDSLPTGCICQPGNETFPRDQYKWNRDPAWAAARCGFLIRRPPEDIAFLWQQPEDLDF